MSHDPQDETPALGADELARWAGRPPAERLSTLLQAPQPMRLVRSLPDLDFYLTLRDVGPIEGLPLVKLASARQMQHLLDLESWRGDRFDADRCGAWAALFVLAGEPTLRRFLRTADDELLVLLFLSWARAEPAAEHDPDPSSSPDGGYRFSPSLPQHALAVQHLSRMLFHEDPKRYERILWATRSELPAEVEEQALRWRDSRLEEHGFPPRAEAPGVYAPPVGAREHPPLGPPDPDGLRAPTAALQQPATPGSPGLDAIGDLPAPTRERLLAELVALANHLLVADAADTGDPQSHRAALAKGLGYVSIALQARGAERSPALDQALAEVPVLELFREGHSRAAELQARARRLCREGWLSAHPRAREILDLPLGPQIAALLGPQPLYVEIGAPGTSPRLRPFERLSEIAESTATLELVELLGQVLVSNLGLDLSSVLREAATAPPLVSTFVLTLLAWHATRGERRLDSLPADVAADFARNIASRRTAAPDAPPRAFEALTTDLARVAGLGPRQTALWRSFGRAALERLAAECAALDPGTPIDPRRVKSLRL